MPTLRSFDIFDTIVARRCVHPHNIFRAVEARAGQPGFAEARVQAEATLYRAGEYTLDDIYGLLQTSFGLSAVTAKYLQSIELSEEFDNFIPIRKHIVEVRPGDLLICDMYLPLDFIKRVVQRKCGLYFNPIYLSAHGKSSGSAWTLLTGLADIEEHTGDNAHSDVDMANRHGVKGRRSVVSNMTPHEILVETLGFGKLAHATRAARLALWSSDPEKQRLAETQIGVNFSTLFLTCLLLVNLAIHKGWKRILFSSRDCFNLYALFERVAERVGLDIEAEYFFTSRVARTAPSPAYLNYFNQLCGSGPVGVVDICGTGWSLTRLFEAAGRPETEMFFVHRIDDPALMNAYRKIAAIGREPNITSLVSTGNNVIFEALNATDHPMVSDVLEANGTFIPTYLDIKTTPRYDELVRWSAEAFSTAAASTDLIDTQEILRWLSVVRVEHVARLYQAMSQQLEAVSGIVSQMLTENGPAMAMLSDRVASAPGRS